MKKYVITDSRALLDPAQTTFVALKTPVGDGHRYIRPLYERGVRDFVVQYVPQDMAGVEDAHFVLTSNSSEYLRESARKALEELPQRPLTVLVTGSRGKTTVKETIYRALLNHRETVRSPRSWNSAIGVPLSVLEAAAQSPQVLVQEVAIDGPGQADAIVPGVLSPDIAVITELTDEHDEAFGSHADKVREKIMLTRGARTIVYIRNDALRCTLEEFYGNDCPRLIPAKNAREIARTVLKESGVDISLPYDNLPAVSTRIDIADAPGNCLVVHDHFTHDLRSLQDSLDFCRRRRIPGQRFTVLMTDLLHRPLSSKEVDGVYRNAASLMRMAGVDRVLTIGPETAQRQHILAMSPDSRGYFSTDEFLEMGAAGDFSNEQILIFGDGSYRLDTLRNNIEYPRHDTCLEVNLSALIHNYNVFRRHLPPSTGIVAMVKASAYGLGAHEVAKTLQSQGAASLAVAVVDEGVSLRVAGITMPIIILNPLTNNFGALFRYNLEPTVFNLRELHRLGQEARKAGVTRWPVHIKVDTGMHRLGFRADDIPSLTAALAHYDDVLKVSSVFSHLATADCLDQDDATESQFAEFKSLTSAIAYELGYPIRRHLLNTAGILRYGLSSGPWDMARLGIGLYGVSPLPPQAWETQLETVATLTTTIISIQHLPAGSRIGYGGRGVLTQPSKIATLPIGYADGYRRQFGCGNASVWVNGVLCPTVGNICMDLCMVDVTDVPEVGIGDRVEVFGPHVTVDQLAEATGTIPYEILTSVSPRVQRVYFRK